MMDIDTKAGMSQAKDWLINHLAMLTDNGVWAIPRSGCLVKINKSDKTYTMHGGTDTSTQRVFEELGWEQR